MLRLRGYGWRHAGRRAWALRGVDLDITPGERILLLGPSGAGKSTLLRAIAGLLPADSGAAEGHLDNAWERPGMVFQDPQSQLVMSRSGDEVAFGLENLGWPADRIWPRVDGVLGDVGFRYAQDRSTSELSGGEQQRLVLAGALAPEPGLLLLDEPTANLDPDGAALVRQALRAVPVATTTILIEHRIAEIVDQVTRVIVLAAGGGIHADGPPALLRGPLGAELAAAGVWVPGHDLPIRKAREKPGGRLLHTENLGVRQMAFPDLAVHEGETVVITGANGSGKSTLALTMGGLHRPGRGAIRTPWGCPQRWRARTLAQHIGSVFQNPEHQFATASVRAELALGGTGPARVDELLQRLHLDQLADANPFTLSGGEARRLSVATALATAPQIMIFDEPTFGQDRRTWIEMIELIAQLRNDGRAVVAVTHDPDVVRSLADRTVQL